MSKQNEHKQQQAKEIKDNLTKVFQAYGKTDVPKDLKEEIFQTLDTVELMAGMMDLFTIKFAQSEIDFIETVADKTNKKTEQ